MSKYLSDLKKFKNLINSSTSKKVDSLIIENMFEMLEERSAINTYEDILGWLKNLRNNPNMQIEDIPLSEMREWSLDTDKGKISHSTGDFFEIVGIRTQTNEREVQSGWDQPLLRQVGFDGGLLGIIRSRINNVPYYLLEAKFEPGNYGFVQLSPTLQATFSNINKKHGGRKPHFCDLFLNRNDDPDVKVLFETWLSEDGGRLDRKRNKGILIEVDPDKIVVPNSNFKWVSLFQIKKLTYENSYLSPHVRGILSYS